MNIKNLISEGEEFEHKGEKIRVYPLSVREQSKFAQLQAEKKFGEASEYLFVATLKKSDDSWTEEDILNITDREFIQEITQAIMRVNGLQTEKQNFPEDQPAQQKQ